MVSIFVFTITILHGESRGNLKRCAGFSTTERASGNSKKAFSQLPVNKTGGNGTHFQQVFQAKHLTGERFTPKKREKRF
jgi:hypothetical protein